METTRIVEEFENATSDDVDELNKKFFDRKAIELEGRKGKWIIVSMNYESCFFEQRIKGTIEYRRTL